MSLCNLVSLKGLSYRIVHQFTLVGRTGSVLIHEDRGSSVPCKTPVEHPEAPHTCPTLARRKHLSIRQSPPGDANCEAQSNRDTGREVRVVWKSDSANPLLPPKVEGVVDSTAPAAHMASGHLREGTGKRTPLSFLFMSYLCVSFPHIATWTYTDSKLTGYNNIIRI